MFCDFGFGFVLQVIDGRSPRNCYVKKAIGTIGFAQNIVFF
jgi:hypothetical protein